MKANPNCTHCYGSGWVGEGPGGCQYDCPQCVRHQMNQLLDKKRAEHLTALAAKDAEIRQLTLVKEDIADTGLKLQVEIERYKRAVHFLVNCGAIKLVDGGTYFYGNTAAGNVPADIAETIISPAAAVGQEGKYG